MSKLTCQWVDENPVVGLDPAKAEIDPGREGGGASLVLAARTCGRRAVGVVPAFTECGHLVLAVETCAQHAEAMAVPTDQEGEASSTEVKCWACGETSRARLGHPRTIRDWYGDWGPGSDPGAPDTQDRRLGDPGELSERLAEGHRARQEGGRTLDQAAEEEFYTVATLHD